MPHTYGETSKPTPHLHYRFEEGGYVFYRGIVPDVAAGPRVSICYDSNTFEVYTHGNPEAVAIFAKELRKALGNVPVESLQKPIRAIITKAAANLDGKLKERIKDARIHIKTGLTVITGQWSLEVLDKMVNEEGYMEEFGGEAETSIRNLKLEKESLSNFFFQIQNGRISCRRGASEILRLVDELKKK